MIGPNGTGKTTLLRTISGILNPRHGSIEFKGRRIDGLRPHEVSKLGIAHIPEARHLFPHMTVLENLEMGAYMHEPRAEKDATLKQVLDLFPVLGRRLRQRASTLSGGEQQMLAIARGLMLRPELLLVDEPSLGLAPRMVETTLSLLQQLHETGITILLVEQDVAAAFGVSDYSYVLENGRIVLEGEPSELRHDKRIQETYIGL